MGILFPQQRLSRWIQMRSENPTVSYSQTLAGINGNKPTMIRLNHIDFQNSDTYYLHMDNFISHCRFSFFSEVYLLLFKLSNQKRTTSETNFNSLKFVWLIIPLCIIASFFVANYGKWTVINYVIAGIDIFVPLMGIIVRRKAIKQLKERFTIHVTILEDHHLKTDGLYKYISHPSYLGTLLNHIGLYIAINSILSFLFIVPIIIVLPNRIKIEEKILENEFGQEYHLYKKKTKKIIIEIY